MTRVPHINKEGGSTTFLIYPGVIRAVKNTEKSAHCSMCVYVCVCVHVCVCVCVCVCIGCQFVHAFMRGMTHVSNTHVQKLATPLLDTPEQEPLQHGLLHFQILRVPLWIHQHAADAVDCAVYP